MASLLKKLQGRINASRSVSRKSNDVGQIEFGNPIPADLAKAVKVDAKIVQDRGQDPMYQLYAACSEIKTSEETFREILRKGLNLVADQKNSIWNIKKEYAKDITPEQLKPHIELSETKAFADINIETLNSSMDLNPIIIDICKETSKHLVDDTKTRKNFIDATVHMSDFNFFYENHPDLNAENNPFILSVQRSMRYSILLRAIIKEAEKVNKENPEKISDSTMKKLNETITETDALVAEMNEIVRIYESSNKKTANFLAANKTFMRALIEEKKRSSLDLPELTLYNIANTIKNKQPNDIKDVLNKYGFTNVSDQTATAIKQDFYYSLIDPAIRDTVRKFADNAPIHATTKVYTAGSSTQYYINELNKAVDKKTGMIDTKIVQNILPKLGFTQDKVQSLCVSIDVRQNPIAEFKQKTSEEKAKSVNEKNPENPSDVNKSTLHKMLQEKEKVLREFRQKLPFFSTHRTKVLFNAHDCFKKFLKAVKENKNVSEKFNELKEALNKANSNMNMLSPDISPKEWWKLE